MLELSVDIVEELLDSPTEANGKKDIDLAFQAAQGNENAFNTLFARHRRRTHSICLRIVDAADAEDLCQEVWLQVFRKITSFKGESAFTTWLHRLSVNQCLMHLRKRTVKMELIVDEEGKFPDIIVPGTERPARMRIVDKIALDEAMAYMPQGYYDVWYYHDVMGFEHEEVAVILGCSVGTSKSQLHKARLKLRRILTRKKMGTATRNVIETRFDRKLGIELPALSLGDWRQAVEEAMTQELEEYEDEEFDIDIGDESL